MRLKPIALLLVALVASGCGGGSSQGRAEGGCVGILQFQHREYLGVTMRGAAPGLAGTAGIAVAPGCGDVVEGPATVAVVPPSTTVEAYKVVGIPVERALARQDEPDIVYVARGVCRDATTPKTLLDCLRGSSD